MDDTVRRLIADLALARGQSLAALSKELGKNHEAPDTRDPGPPGPRPRLIGLFLISAPTQQRASARNAQAPSARKRQEPPCTDSIDMRLLHYSEKSHPFG
jgi:hypothetical protein